MARQPAFEIGDGSEVQQRLTEIVQLVDRKPSHRHHYVLRYGVTKEPTTDLARDKILSSKSLAPLNALLDPLIDSLFFSIRYSAMVVFFSAGASRENSRSYCFISSAFSISPN